MSQSSNFVTTCVPGLTSDKTSTATPSLAYEGLWLDGLHSAGRAEINWLWPGYLASGNVTLLTSQWKTGKTTLVSVLLARLKTGGTFAGLPLRPCKAAVVTEEDPSLWLHRSETLDFSANVCWFCRPFRGLPTPEGWQSLLDSLIDLHRQHGTELVVIDPLASFLPGRNENSASVMLQTLLPLVMR